MKDYQKTYLENLNRIADLSDITLDLSMDAEQFLHRRQENRKIIKTLVQNNTDLLRRELFPLLDDIISASPEDIRELEEFAAALVPGGNPLDITLNYTIHCSLTSYARQWKQRDLLIRELYNTGMALFHLNTMIANYDPERYRWKMQMAFGEAASYIRVYDDIQDPTTRGFIHRSMANLALAYSSAGQAYSKVELGQRKMGIIRRSLQVLTDPAFQAKTPSLPWGTFIYKSHQERTASLTFLRTGQADAQAIREVMESAQYVWERQVEISKRTGRPPSTRWHVTYEIAQYHCGILTLNQLLKRMERLYLQRDLSDFTSEGIYSNLFLPTVYAEYLSYNDQYKSAKKEVLSHMYRMMLRYVRSVPASHMSITLVRNIMNTFLNFIEYPGGIKQKDFLLQLVICRNPEAFVYMQMTATTARMLTKRILRDEPRLLLGVLGCDTVEKVLASGDQISDLAYGCGMFHNIGQLNFTKMTVMTGRNWFKEEQELFRLHTDIGARILSRCESTRPYADAAAGHHRYFDGTGGYPEAYDRTKHANQVIVDIVNLSAFFNRLLDNTIDYTKEPLSLHQAMDRVLDKSGTRFSPDIVRLFMTMEPDLEDYLKDGRIRAYHMAFQYLKNEDSSL